MKLTVYFDGTLWCGLIEYAGKNDDYRVFKHIFGPEPKNAEIEHFVNWDLSLLVDRNDYKWSSIKNISEKELPKGKINPKRMQRKINKEKNIGISTKAQKTISESRSQYKILKKKQSKKDKEEEKKERFEKKMQKKYKKRKGH
ncbi:YjdF family protein [Enterococcus sp. 4G2_DIV0659]|uniref:DUF2992 domain-containing protein n=1 Tax=Candidatus Enterococcus mansonii TaxID=1834181 RepID=A0A242CIF7_9ENTE|nr:hypothetical protein A5880_000370 [Enterococcus sp. 4G2_DIV0659]